LFDENIISIAGINNEIFIYSIDKQLTQKSSNDDSQIRKKFKNIFD